MIVSDAAISDALLISIRDGTYPESEEILTTELSGSVLRPSLQFMSEAKQKIEVRGAPQLLNEVLLIMHTVDGHSRPQSK